MAFGHYTRPPRGLGRSFDFRLTPSTFRLYFALRARSGVALPRHDLAPSGVSRIQSALPMRERFAGRSPKKRTATKSVRVNARAAQRVAALSKSNLAPRIGGCIGFADAPKPAAAQPRKAKSDNASGVGCFAAVGAEPLSY